MPLLTYQQTRPWAAAIKQAVVLRKMPPWFADASPHQPYRDNLSLSAKERATITGWVEGGSLEGDPKDAPAPRTFVEGWNIGQPDRILEMPEAYQVPATGIVEYTYIIMPSGFTKDTWVQAMEIRPGNRATMHHSILYSRQRGSKWLGEYPMNVPFVPAPRPGTKHRGSDGDRFGEGTSADEWLVGYVPGQHPLILPEDTAFLVKAGSDFVLQVHYTPNGKAVSDRTKIGFIFAKSPPIHRAYISNRMFNGEFEIPPGNPDYAVDASATLAAEVNLLGASPHMHLRGKSMSLRAVYPNGKDDTIFNVPRYDFNWQQMYTFATPLTLPKGTKLEMKVTFDNSPNNPNNPDPTATVKWGDQTTDEMALGVMALQIKPDADLDTLFEEPPKKEPSPVATAAAERKQ